jgi:type III restriction enzyme
MASLGFKEVVERQAAEQIKNWRDAQASAVARKPRSVRDLIEPLWYLGSSPMHPTTVEGRKTYPAATEKAAGEQTRAIPVYPHHLYVIPAGKASAGMFPVDTSRSSWEGNVLERELSADTLIGWYRNPNSGRYALAVPYNFGEKTLLMHPDFMFWHTDGPDTVMDIVDPHRHDLADAGPKWSALAKYATDHADRVRRALAIIRDTAGELRALDLATDGISDKLAAATSKDALEALFRSDGMAY